MLFKQIAKGLIREFLKIHHSVARQHIERQPSLVIEHYALAGLVSVSRDGIEPHKCGALQINRTSRLGASTIALNADPCSGDTADRHFGPDCRHQLCLRSSATTSYFMGMVLAPEPHAAANQFSAVSALANSASRSASWFRPQVRTRSDAFVQLGA
jgi:hypothetical protein